ncbi:HD domain-containing protein [Geobacter hydrogenophilus]|uniref:HD/PDEase domain-containing protein n=1 Tax=Geobacter hydrogenophilus TaxID=40983 RepID=A0A9W6LCT6_9BACT|nr:HD domain-containing protein [Geobacter hydrogenophilus]MBT0893549.1 HD domain-containing protein [Geobacter hydrogenophilus]GLI37756.1 hypothetical protein GHYDROH2_12570 [Geobacter hydrogenophilus]
MESFLETACRNSLGGGIRQAAEDAQKGDGELIRFIENFVMEPNRLSAMAGFTMAECETIHAAARVAEDLHHGQLRKGTDIPYIMHPFGAAALLLREECTPDMVVAGLLHDTIEDTDYTIEELAKDFGPNVAAIVEGCSEPFKDRPWRERKEHTISYLSAAPRQIRFVSCADKLHNITAISRDYEMLGDGLWRRFKAGREDQSWYYWGLVESFRHELFVKTRLFRDFECMVNKVFDAQY